MALFVDIEKTLGSFRLAMRFETEPCEVLGLLGASGCGKSMTLRCIAGIEKPDLGRIVLNGRTLFDSEQHIDLPPQKRRVGYLFQQYALFPNMTVQQNIACGARGRDDCANAVAEVISALHLTGLEQRKPAELSGGQQQRTALARILVNRPDVLLLDEPFSALDSQLRFSLEQQVRTILSRFGGDAVLVSHNRDEVFRLCSHIAVMQNGTIETIGEKHAVFSAPQTEAGARMTGCRNISPVRILDAATVFAEKWQLSLRTAGDLSGVTHIGIRVHEPVLRETPEGENVIECRITEQIENPFSVTLLLRAEAAPAAEPIAVEVQKARRPQGQTVSLYLAPERILLLRSRAEQTEEKELSHEKS